MHNEVRAEKIGPVAPSAIALTGTREIEVRGLQKLVLDMESCVERILRVFGHQRPEKIRSHSCMKILADFERDFELLRERGRNMLGDLILGGVEAREGSKIHRGWAWRRLDLQPRTGQRFAKNSFGKFRG